ncbi:MAG: galactose-1-phosphate uridylyltransferase [Lacipirellulaceae bacterium]
MSEWRDEPLTGRRVRVARARAERPSDLLDGGVPPARACPFCAGAEGMTPPELSRLPDDAGGWRVRVVPNRYPALDGPDGSQEVIVEAPRHALRFADLSPDEATAAVATWAQRIAHHRDSGESAYTVVFKNEGAAAGASLGHVHTQLVTLRDPPRGPALAVPLGPGAIRDPLVFESHAAAPGLVAMSSPAPRFAYECWVAPRDPRADFAALADAPDEAAGVARLLRRVIVAATGAAGAAGFNLVVHTPGRDDPRSGWLIEVTPRVAQVAGFELATGLWINVVSPEAARDRLAEMARDA